MPQITIWDRRLYFPSDGKRAGDFFALKIQRLRPVLNPRTRIPEASTLTSRPPKPPSIPISPEITNKTWSLLIARLRESTLADKARFLLVSRVAVST